MKRKVIRAMAVGVLTIVMFMTLGNAWVGIGYVASGNSACGRGCGAAIGLLGVMDAALWGAAVGATAGGPAGAVAGLIVGL